MDMIMAIHMGYSIVTIIRTATTTIRTEWWTRP